MGMAERLQELRKTENYSQEQLADMLGISRQAISKWESAQGKPEIDNIIKLAEIYNVSSDYILLGKEPNPVMVEPNQKKELSHTARKTIGVIAIIASTAVITVLFIAALKMLSKLSF